VIREHERARLKRLLAELPPGNLTDDEAARLADEMRHEVGGASEPGPASSPRSRPGARRRLGLERLTFKAPSASQRM
jgi:hypothetical protein